MFRKVELWVLLLVILVSLVAMIGFGSLVRQALVDEEPGGLSRTALFIAEIPMNLQLIAQLATQPDAAQPRATHEAAVQAEANPDQVQVNIDEVTQAELDLFDGRGGFTAFADVPPGYLLIPRSLPGLQSYVTELFDLTSRKVVHAWHDRRMTSPRLADGLDLVYLGLEGQLIRSDACGVPRFVKSDFHYHHTFSIAPDGSIWAIGYPKADRHLPGDSFDENFYHPDYKDDSLIHIGSSGEILDIISLTSIFIEHNLHNLLFVGREDHFHPDPLHINDVQPVVTDGPFFKAGQLFVSLGHQDMILLLDPVSREILWRSDGTGLFHQHDVDILNENEIAVFDNNRIILEREKIFSEFNTIDVYDFRLQQWRTIHQPIMEQLEIMTINQGLFEKFESGVFVEEQNRGRLLFFTDEGPVWEYVNRDPETGKIFQVHWSDIVMDAGKLAEIREDLSRLDCD